MLTGAVVHLDPFKTVQPPHFLCHESILKEMLDNVTGDNPDHMWCILVTIFCAFPLCLVQPLCCWTYFSFHSFLHLLCSCFRVDLTSSVMWYLNSPSLLPSDSLTVLSPSSACVRSSMSEYQCHRRHLVSRLECLLTPPPLLPSLLAHLPPKILTPT